MSAVKINKSWEIKRKYFLTTSKLLFLMASAISFQNIFNTEALTSILKVENWIAIEKKLVLRSQHTFELAIVIKFLYYLFHIYRIIFKEICMTFSK